MPTLRNISPLGDLDIRGVGTVKAGETFEVSDDVAGAAPKGEPGSKGHHPGSGLLAQTDNYEPASKKKD